MSFIAPGFVFFTALLAIPIAIHLIGRSRARVRRFAALDLLLHSQRRVAQRTRLRQLLLLALRALIIAAVPLILAKPFCETSSDLPATIGTSQSAVIVLDDSLSMSLDWHGQPLLSLAKARARRLVAALGHDADAALVLAGRGSGAPVGELTADRARLERAIANVRPSYRATDVNGALKRAAQILQNSAHPERRIYLLSDMAAHGFLSEPPWGNGGPDVVAVDVAEGPHPNRAITDLKVEPAPQLGPRGVRVSVEVGNFADTVAKELPITLYVDKKPVAKGLIDLQPWEKGLKRFVHTFDPRPGAEASESSMHDLEVQLASDALTADDHRYARVEVRRNVRVLVVDGDPRTVRRDDEVFYLETALRPGDRDDSQLDVSTISADELGHRRLDYDVVFLCNVKAPFDATELSSFVEEGGGLFISVGDNVDPDAYNRTLGALLPQPLETVRATAALPSTRNEGESHLGGAGEHLGRAELHHPLLGPLSGDGSLHSASFFRYLLFRPLASATSRAPEERQVLLRFESGAPALVEASRGRGRVLLFASSIDRDWTDLPIQPAYLPLVQQATRYLARAQTGEPAPPRRIGERHELALPAGTERVELTLPSGQRRLLEKEHVVGRHTLAVPDLDEPGIYRVAVAGTDGHLRPWPQATFVVNLDPAESDLRRLAPDELRRLAAGGNTATAVKAPRRRVELWHAFGAGLLVLLLGEALLLRRK